MWGRALRWISLIATAVPLAALAAHVLELPNKLRLDGPLWLAVQQNLYRGWGPLVAPFEIAAIVAAWLLVYLTRRRPPILAWVLAAAVCLSALLAEFFLVVEPVNVAVAGWTAETLPADWPDYRRQWEIGHAVGFVLALAAFCALLRGAFLEARAAALRQQTIEKPVALVDEA
jgi:hypothetical protein